MRTPERTASRAKTSRVHTISAQYCRHDCCIHRWTHRLPSISSSPLAPKHRITRKIPSTPWGLPRHIAPTAVGYCCSYCYNTRGWDRLAQIIVNQGETRKRGGIHTRVFDGGGQAVQMGCHQAAPFPPLAVPSPAVSLQALLSRSAMLAGPLLSRAGGARSMPPNPAQKVPPVAHNVPPGPHSQDVNSCPKENERGYKQIPSDLLGGYRPPGRLLLQLQRLSSAAGFRLTPKGGMYVCMYVCIY